MALDICFDLQTFLERTCRACSRYYSEEGVDFHHIFENSETKSSEEEQPSDDVKEIYEELKIWKLNIKPCDGLPQQICNDCYKRFVMVKSFRDECLDTQKVLESYFKDFDKLLENASQGRISPKAESVKSAFEVNDAVNPALTSSMLEGSPKLTLGSPKYNDLIYAESSMGTPPPLFEEIATEPFDIQTLDYIKTETELEQTETTANIDIKIENDQDILFEPIKTKQVKVQKNFSSSDDESSTPTSDEEESDSDNEIDATTENDDESTLALAMTINKRNKNVNFNYDPRNPLQCRICYAAFVKRSMLKEHHARAHPQEKPFVCNICASAFKSNFLLRQHQLRHNRPDTIKCELCEKYFRSQLHLQRHAKNFHLTSNYTCHICHEKFENYTQIRFQYHVRQHGEKRFHCSHQYCEKSFHQKIHLINHERTHSKEQPFSCNICGKAYRQQTACQEHMLTHKDPTPFKCKVCKKGFTQRSSLRMHFRTHEEGSRRTTTKQELCFQCKFCGQNFAQKVHFEMHELTHSMKRKCAYCGEVYPNEISLKTHLKTHAQQLNCFQCQYCNNTFQKQQTLLLHEKQHEQEKRHYLDTLNKTHDMPSTLEDSEDHFDEDILNYNYNNKKI